MGYRSVNLAARPFVNHAPVKRLALLAWVVAVAVTAVTVALYWGYFAASAEEARSELTATTARIAELEEELARLEVQLAGTDLAAMNSEVAFLNHRIARRTFGWSRLFDDLAEVLPADVRLQRLSPGLERAGEDRPRRVLLGIDGAARRDEALLELIDNMFRHPRFDDPNPESEVRRDGELRFSLSVKYLPTDEPIAAPRGVTEAGEGAP